MKLFTIQGPNMPEPTSSTVAGVAIGWKILGLGALVGSGVLGAVIMAIFEPPKDKKTLFMQAAVAGVGSLFFGPLATRILDHYVSFLNLSTAPALEVLEVAAPLYLIIGALSWGAFGALSKLRELVREKAAEKVAGRFGL